MFTIYSLNVIYFFDKMMLFTFIIPFEIQISDSETKLSFSCIFIFICMSSIERKQKRSFLSLFNSVTLKMVLRAMRAQLLLC